MSKLYEFYKNNSVILTNIYIMFYYIKIYAISEYKGPSCQHRR